MPQYTVEDYARLRSIPELTKRFNNCEILARAWVRHRDELQRCKDEPQFLDEQIKRWNEKLNDTTEELKNILVAIEMLKLGN